MGRETDRSFVGRQVELAAFESAIESARRGTPTVLLIGGDAGIGKSSLIREAAGRAAVPLVVGRCVPVGGEAVPLGPLADLLQHVGRVHPQPLGTTAGMAPTWLLGDDVGGPAAVFGHVLDLVRELASSGPVVVALEDLHWADPTTWHVFDFLARNLLDEQVVLVGSHRVREAGARPLLLRGLAELLRLPSVQRHVLDGLERADVEAHVEALVDGHARADLVDSVLARGRGNPFFTEQLVAAHLAGDDIPIVLSDLVSAELLELDQPTRHVLALLSAMGAETHHRLLSRLSSLDEDELDAAVRTAVAARLVEADGAAGSYRFRHGLIGEVVYADLLPSERTRIHQRIADALDTGAGRPDEAALRAFHLDRAGDAPAAFGALLAAADAAAGFAPGTALQHLERALELWDGLGPAVGDESRSHRLWQAAELASGAVSNDRAVVLAEQALALGPPPEGEAWAYERLGRYLWASGRLERSRHAYERAAALVDATDAWAPRVFAGLAQADLMAGRHDDATSWCARVLDEPGAGPPDALAQSTALRVRGVAVARSGDPSGAVDLCRAAVATAPTAHARAMAVLYLCVTLLDAGEYQLAVDEALDAASVGRVAGLEASFGGYLAALAAEGLVRLGRWDEAGHLLEGHLDEAALPVGTMRVACAAALLAARRGDPAGARAHLERARALPVDGWHATVLDMVAADVHLALGDWDEAAAAAMRGSATTPPAAALWAARLTLYAAEAAVESELDARASGVSSDPAAIVRQQRERIDAVRAVLGGGTAAPAADTVAHLAQAEATVTRLEGPSPVAWASAAAAWRALGDDWRVAGALAREAEAAAAVGAAAEAADTLREANRIAVALGARRLVDELDALSRRTRISLDAPVPVPVHDLTLAGLGLTPREAEVLSWVATGMTNREIGRQLYVSEKTVSVHLSNLMRKLDVASRVEAAAVAQRIGVPPPVRSEHV